MYIYLYDTQMRVVATRGFRGRCELRGPFIGAMYIFRLLLPPSCPPPWTSPGEGLPARPCG